MRLAVQLSPAGPCHWNLLKVLKSCQVLPAGTWASSMLTYPQASSSKDLPHILS